MTKNIRDCAFRLYASGVNGGSNHDTLMHGKSYFADLRMTFRQKYFLQDWFKNKLGVGLG
jgi:zona occludens toxin (predicted ATPase)